MKTIPRPIKNYIRKTIGKSQETKKLVWYDAGDKLTPNTLASYNVLYQSAQGDSKYTFTGEQFLLKGINVKYSLTNYVETITSSGYCPSTLVFHMYIIQTDIYKTTGQLTIADIMDQGAGNLVNNAEIHHFDKEKCRVIAHKKLVFNPASIGTNGGVNGNCVCKTGSVWVSLNKTLKFKDYGTNAAPNWDLKSGNYYIVFFAGVPEHTQYITSGRVNTIDCQVYFKDA